eukprot:7383774-Prymnesium_polylepis.2
MRGGDEVYFGDHRRATIHSSTGVGQPRKKWKVAGVDSPVTTAQARAAVDDSPRLIECKGSWRRRTEVNRGSRSWDAQECVAVHDG